MVKRTVFTKEENQFLVSLIQKRKKIIECKETNKVSQIRKNEAWFNIEREFNLYFGVTSCTAKQLQQRYLNIKKDAAKLAASQRIELRKTGNKEIITLDLETIHKIVLAMGTIKIPITTFLIMMHPTWILLQHKVSKEWLFTINIYNNYKVY